MSEVLSSGCYYIHNRDKPPDDPIDVTEDAIMNYDGLCIAHDINNIMSYYLLY
jgi:hypothetical protein